VSDTDSFIDEVSEEVRRDRLYSLMRRYGWLAILSVVLLVGGAAYNEWNKAKARQNAESLGDAILAALELPERSDRATALAAIETPNAGAAAVVAMMAASEDLAEAPDAAVTRLLKLADRGDVSPVYRQIATLKAVMIPDTGLTDADRRERLEGLTLASGVIRLLAEEQLAYLDVAAGASDAALERFRQIYVDSEATVGLRNRVAQVIVALGGEITGS